MKSLSSKAHKLGTRTEQFVPSLLENAHENTYTTDMTFNYIGKLKDSFREKKTRNPSYSLRAFSRDLGVSVTALSDVLAGKRNFSEKNAEKISEALCLSNEELRQMIAAIKGREYVADATKKNLELEEDEFRLISEWHYLALLTIAKQKNVKAKEKILAKRLGISETKIKEALKTLERLKYINIGEDLVMTRTGNSIATTTDIPSYAIRHYHKSNLEVAIHALDNIEPKMREINSMTLNIDPKKISVAKKMIDDFRDVFEDVMGRMDQKEAYTLSVNFFPATLQKEPKK